MNFAILMPKKKRNGLPGADAASAAACAIGFYVSCHVQKRIYKIRIWFGLTATILCEKKNC
jgi:hypothetical protein